MVDKLDAMIGRGVTFRKDFAELHRELRHNPQFGPFKPSKHYQAVADLRPLGLDAVLHFQQRRTLTHKIELLDAGTKGMAQLESMLETIVDQDPSTHRVGRVDLAVDVEDVPLAWFRDHLGVQFKRFLCTHGKLAQIEFSEMGMKEYQTLYFGKRPACIRIYDKIAERQAEYQLWARREERDSKRAWLSQIAASSDCSHYLAPELPAFEEWVAGQLPHVKPRQVELQLPGMEEPRQLSFPVVTRVENQLGGRVPQELKTVAELKKNVRDFNPFSRVRITVGSTQRAPGAFDCGPDGNYLYSLRDWAMGMFVNQNWQTLGPTEIRRILNRDRNAQRYLQKLQAFIPADDAISITPAELYERFNESVSRQLAA